MEKKNYQVDLTTHVLLLLFTLGIYHLVWIYRITEYTNQLKPSEERNTTANLLLCLFVPFYTIFWYYKTSEIIFECLDIDDNSFKMMILIFSIFVPVVSAVLVQDKINKVQEVNSNTENNFVQNSSEYNAADSSFDDNSAIAEIKKFKELLDIGAITQAEFDIKKKELLNL